MCPGVSGCVRGVSGRVRVCPGVWGVCPGVSGCVGSVCGCGCVGVVSDHAPPLLFARKKGKRGAGAHVGG